MNRITILLAEDNKIVREGLRALLADEEDIEVVGEAGNGHQAVAFACRLVPDVIVMDISMPLLDGLEAVRRIREAVPASTKVLVLSAHSGEAYISEARALGAVGYLVKQTDAAALAGAIRKVHDGAPFVCGALKSSQPG